MLTIRQRRPEDVPALLAALRAQQPATGYPQDGREAKESFITRPHELATFVAELDGVPVGHASAQDASAVDHDEDGSVRAAWERGHGRPATELAVISALFVAPSARGRGIGAALLDAATAWCRAEGFGPCLDVVPNKTRVMEMYWARGWVTVAELPTVWMVPGSPLVHVMVLPGE